MAIRALQRRGSRSWWTPLIAVHLVLTAACAGQEDSATSPSDAATSLTSTDSSVEPALSTTASSPDGDWFTVDLEGFVAGPVVDTSCCVGDPAVSNLTSVAWVRAMSDGTQLLLLTADRSPQITDPFPLDGQYTRIVADGSRWDFSSFGMTTAERAALADSVVLDGEDFVLPDSSFAVVPSDVSSGSSVSQVYAGAAQRITVSVGDSAPIAALMRSQSVRARTTEGRPGFEAVGYPNTWGNSEVRLVWPTAGGQWASVHTTSVADSAPPSLDVLAASIAPAGSPSVVPVVGSGLDGEFFGDLLVSETPDHGPMIAFVLEGPLRAGGDVPLTNWDWDAVTDDGEGAGFHWGGPWRLVGTWDGESFTLTQPPVPVPEPTSAPLLPPTEGCDEQAFTATRTQMSQLDRTEVGPFTDNVIDTGGECGIVVDAFVDSDALRELLAPFDDIVRFNFKLQPVD